MITRYLKNGRKTTKGYIDTNQLLGLVYFGVILMVIVIIAVIF